MLIALCKMCNNHGYIPQAMYINMRLDEDLIAEYAGNSTVVKGTYKDRQVAVKVVHVYQTSNCEKDLQASTTSPCIVEPFADMEVRNSSGRLLPGGTSGTQTCYH